MFLARFAADNQDCVSVCVCCVHPRPRVWACFLLSVWVTSTQTLMRGEDNQKRRCLQVVTSTVTAPQIGASSALKFPSTVSPNAPLSFSLGPFCTASTCYCCPPARLLVYSSVCCPASGLRRPASFIKRKQAGEVSGDVGWGQLSCWQPHWGSKGGSHWKQARYRILSVAS